MLKKIVVIGPESTGKSTLCEQLALHYNTSWCPEFAREYLLKNGTRYNYDDLLTIAKGQLALEDKYIKKVTTPHSRLPTHDSRSSAPNSLLFIDTDMYVMKVWSEYVFGKCPRFILDQLVERKYDLYLLCNTDLPWVKDELREYPDLESRRRLYHYYKDLMVNQDTPWEDISGDQQERLQAAITATEKLLK
ncbi:MAG: ATP-binding protein [Chitinophagaceae bacterium]